MTLRVFKCPFCGYRFRADPEEQWQVGETSIMRTIRGTKAELVPAEHKRTVDLTCLNCGQEFEDFLAIAKGEKRPDIFWHNKEWLTMWSAWLDYRESIGDFVDSAEFKRILEEIDRGW